MMRGQRVFEQDKGVRRVRRKSACDHAEASATPNPPYSAVLRSRWPIVVLLVGTSVAWTSAALGLRVNLSPSVPRGIYRTVDAPPARGALVAVCLPPASAAFARERGYLRSGDCRTGVQPVIKRVSAVGGDTVDVTQIGVRVNEHPLPDTATAAADSRGRTLPHVPWGRHVVRSGDVWLLGTRSPRSWDSRYFGPLSAAQIRATVRPVLTIE
jgi:conjugative transfer signal peptidase TraF